MTDRADFQALLETVRRAVSPTLRLPEPVFQPRYVKTYFLEFSIFGSEGFWVLLQALMRESNDEGVCLAVVEPDPETYFYKEFGRFGALRILKGATPEQYRHALIEGPGPSPDTFLDNSEVIVWVPPSRRWLIWGERSPEIMVLACDRHLSGAVVDAIERIPVSLLTAEEALELASPAWRDRHSRVEFAHQLMAHYGEGRTGTDDVRRVIIHLANNMISGVIGIIEGSRELVTLRNEVDPSILEMFQVFVVIASETDDLPIGPLRHQWEATALRRKDIEIARVEQMYRTEAIAACRKLIEKLM